MDKGLDVWACRYAVIVRQDTRWLRGVVSHRCHTRRGGLRAHLLHAPLTLVDFSTGHVKG